MVRCCWADGAVGGVAASEALLCSSPRRVPGLLICFFFSSRRRHTRLQGDWSSDVCSSDLMPARRLDSPDLYLNPHLSLLAFQRRVLEEALDPANPLLERLKFISILGSNIDEFFMVRVAGLWQQIETRTTEISMDGKSPGEQLELIRHDVTSLMEDIYKL